MRISDWSSDVCSSDLARGDGKDGHLVLFRRPFVHALLERLHAQDRGQLEAADAGALENFLKESSEGAVIKGMLTAGSTAGKSRSEEHTSELQSLMRISYAVFCLKKKKKTKNKERY